MGWTVNYSESALRQLKMLDKSIALRVVDHMDQRVGDIRVICNIQDGEMCVLLIQIGNRREVYR